jgi:hypothetical protein
LGGDRRLLLKPPNGRGKSLQLRPSMAAAGWADRRRADSLGDRSPLYLRPGRTRIISFAQSVHAGTQRVSPPPGSHSDLLGRRRGANTGRRWEPPPTRVDPSAALPLTRAVTRPRGALSPSRCLGRLAANSSALWTSGARPRGRPGRALARHRSRTQRADASSAPICGSADSRRSSARKAADFHRFPQQGLASGWRPRPIADVNPPSGGPAPKIFGATGHPVA